jgi:hypothetical protein
MKHEMKITKELMFRRLAEKGYYWDVRHHGGTHGFKPGFKTCAIEFIFEIFGIVSYHEVNSCFNLCGLEEVGKRTYSEVCSQFRKDLAVKTSKVTEDTKKVIEVFKNMKIHKLDVSDETFDPEVSAFTVDSITLRFVDRKTGMLNLKQVTLSMDQLREVREWTNFLCPEDKTFAKIQGFVNQFGVDELRNVALWFKNTGMAPFEWISAFTEQFGVAGLNRMLNEVIPLVKEMGSDTFIEHIEAVGLLAA